MARLCVVRQRLVESRSRGRQRNRKTEAACVRSLAGNSESRLQGDSRRAERYKTGTISAARKAVQVHASSTQARVSGNIKIMGAEKAREATAKRTERTLEAGETRKNSV